LIFLWFPYRRFHRFYQFLSFTVLYHPLWSPWLDIRNLFAHSSRSGSIPGDWSMGRNPDIWGEDCLEFKPYTRWIDEKGELVRESQWKMHAFNGGPRICLGLTLATFEAVSVLSTLVQHFDFSFPEGWWENVEKSKGIEGVSIDVTPLYLPSTTLPMKHPMPVLVKNRLL